MSVFLDAFDRQLKPYVVELVRVHLNALEVADMMQLIDWLEFYVHQSKAFEVSDAGTAPAGGALGIGVTGEGGEALGEEAEDESARGFVSRTRSGEEEYLEMAQNLIHEYLDRIKRQVREWFNNIKKHTVEIAKAPDGTLITTVPEDMFNVVYMQLAVAQEKLPKEHLKDAVNACLQVLREVQRQSYDQLEEDWERGVDPEALCALVNDMQRLQEKAEELFGKVIRAVQQDEDRDMLTQMLEDVSSEYVSIANVAKTYLTR